MAAPFHAVGILDPRLTRVGFGSYREGDGGVQMAAALDVIRGLGALPAGTRYPIFWPAEGMTLPLRSFWGEYPDPLTSCPGYRLPTGLPIIVQFGAGERTPRVTAHSLRDGGTALEHCVITEESYVNPDAGAQQTGRLILGQRDAVVLIPRQRLAGGATYTASLTVDGQTYSWTFAVAPAAQ